MKRLTKILNVLIVYVLLSFFTSALVNASELDDEIIKNVQTQTIQNKIPIYSSIDEWEQSGNTSDVVRIQNQKARYLGGYADYIYTRTEYSYDTRVGYHPDFDDWIYSDGYYFSSSKKTTFTPSVSLSWGPKLSVGVSVAKAGSSGFFRYANGSKRSRPWVRADIETRIYDMYLYDEFGKLYGIYRDTYKVSKSSDIQIFVDHIY